MELIRRSLNRCLKNKALVKILFTLNYDRENFYIDESGRTRFRQFPFNIIKPRLLGSIYEAFLEYSLKIANTDMIYRDGKWKAHDISTRKFLEKARSSKSPTPVVRKGGFYFEIASENLRKESSSYYTPHDIVESVVQKTISPLLEGKKPDEILIN